MEVVHERCAGLDVHKDTVVACARVISEGKVEQDVKTFGTTTKELLALSDWLREHGCTHAAMESTGVYWKARARGFGGTGLGERDAHPQCSGSEDRCKRC